MWRSSNAKITFLYRVLKQVSSLCQFIEKLNYISTAVCVHSCNSEKQESPVGNCKTKCNGSRLDCDKSRAIQFVSVQLAGYRYVPDTQCSHIYGFYCGPSFSDIFSVSSSATKPQESDYKLSRSILWTIMKPEARFLECVPRIVLDKIPKKLAIVSVNKSHEKKIQVQKNKKKVVLLVNVAAYALQSSIRQCVENCSYLWDESAKYQLIAYAYDSVEKCARRLNGDVTFDNLQSLTHFSKVACMTIF